MPRFVRRSKRKSRRRSKSSFGNQGAPMARKYACVLKYQDEVTFAPGAAGVSTHVFSANGIFDPDITGVGHQPRGYDQIQPMYDHYVVVGSTINATFVNNGATSLLVGISLRDNDVASTFANDYIEGQAVRWAVIPAAQGGNGLQKTISMKINPARFLGRSKPLADPDLKGNVGANPLEGCFYHLFVGSQDGGDPPIITTSVDLTYSTLFIEPRPVTQS